MSTIIPLIKGALMYAESLGEAVPKLPSNIEQKSVVKIWTLLNWKEILEG
ncbi:hypothetical protein [Streptococcus sanguinis]|jgi:hypothetical protein|uniref:Uncharacterized protein n=1 Tax=Streptococcus sanguinis SK355 TaxID=888816 RepID=F3UNP4_STRSA|nr:hypothetical protein [Streptococcus sanguinis]EGJ43230.1 hypothetical protein HMPREF9389_0452 [Streptococcus sanguinis SK355]